MAKQSSSFFSFLVCARNCAGLKGEGDTFSDECDRIAVVASSETVFENPSTGIHRGIVHTVYSQAADLYRLLYPRFYPGPDEEVVPTQIAYLLPVPLTGPDYQQIAISRAVTFLVTQPSSPSFQLKSIRQQLAWVDQAAQPFHSAAFPLDYDSFRDKVYRGWKDATA